MLQKSIRLFVAALILGATVMVALAQKWDTPGIDSAMNDAMKFWQTPGAAIVVIKGDQIVFMKGYGVRDVKTKEAVTPDTVFAIGSTTKAFTTAAMAMLADDGKLSWDDPVRKHVSYFRLSDPLANDNVALRDIVTHRTGLVRHDMLWYGSPWNREEIVRRIGFVPLSYGFRTTFQYQNIMFLTAGLAVGNAAGSSWEEFLQRRIFDPLGMKSASLSTTVAEKSPDHATPHQKKGSGIETMPWRNIDNVAPAGSINASVRDLSNWIQLQLNEGVVDGKRLISAENVREMHTPQMVIRNEGRWQLFFPPSETSQLSYGLGWFINDYRGRKLVMHGGTIDGFRASIVLVPSSKLGVAVLANLNGTQMPEAVCYTVVDLLEALPKKNWNASIAESAKQFEAETNKALLTRLAARKKDTKPSRELAAYVGSYEDAGYGKAEISLEGDVLILSWSNFKTKLQHFHFDTFSPTEPRLLTEQVQFQLGADGEVSAIQNIGEAYDLLGEKQKALDYYAQALTLARSIGAKQVEGIISTNLATLYSSLGEKEKARDMYLQALEIHRATGNRTTEADTLHLLGFLHYELEDTQRALDYLTQALPVWRQLKDKRGEAITLTATGMVYRSLDQRDKSLEFSNQGLPLHREVGNRAGEAETLINIGLIESASGEKQKAFENFNRAAELSRAISDPALEAKAKYEIARVKLDTGELDQARSQIEDTLNIVESLRTKVASQELRASYFATVQKYYDFYIELLMRMNGRQVGKGFSGEALQVSERARARSLLEILAEANASIREGVDATLLEREQRLHHQLSGKADALARLYASRPTPEQVVAAKKEVDDLTAQYNDVRAEIRRASPRYAALTQPSPLSLKEIQQQVLDNDTLLLEYWLGEKRSYLWAVTPTKITSYVLPARAKIESAARDSYEWLSKPAQANAKRRLKHDGVEMSESERRARGLQALTYLSNTLIKPVAAQLGKKRLVVVASGALQYVPFAALTVASNRSPVAGKKTQLNQLPTTDHRPLIQDHEVINLPSVSTMAVLRRDTGQRQVAPKMLAVLADPVFEKDDERVGKMARPIVGNATAQPKEAEKSQSQAVAEERSLKHMKEKSAEETGEMKISRLPFTRQEAEQILALVPEAERKQALDFDASRATATAKDLSQYRYVHFATHGYLDSERPEFSALVLSLINKDGVQQSGFLYAYDVYNLQLNSDLVVLSACETGLGKEIKGEGLVGLTRGFMYAGAPRVVVSLWSVNDRATADLMARFYRKMLKENLRPAAALRAAQIEMLKESRWREPYYWAAFALQGEWR